MRITIHVQKEDLENLNNFLTTDNPGSMKSIRILRYRSLDYVEVSLQYSEYTRCTDLEIFEELLSL